MVHRAAQRLTQLKRVLIKTTASIMGVLSSNDFKKNVVDHILIAQLANIVGDLESRAVARSFS